MYRTEKENRGGHWLAVMRRWVPLPAAVLFTFAAVAAVFHLISCLQSGFADTINGTVGACFRQALAFLTNGIPFSLGESLLLALPVLLVLLVVFAVRACRTREGFVRYLSALLAIPALLYGLFVFTLGCGYRGSPLDEKMGLARAPSAAADLYDTAKRLQTEVNALASELTWRYEGGSVMPYSYAEMNEKLLSAYDQVSLSYPFVQKMPSRLKLVSNSEFMSYLHLTGVYSYMTGEANINHEPPDYTIPYTAAHELAHQRGIAREDEANFVAFLVCAASDDTYIRYSGCLNLMEYVTSALYRADRELYRSVWNDHADTVKYEIYGYQTYYKKYADSKLGEVSGAVNNAYLQSQGTAGTKSYGMVVDLAVAYFRSR